MGLTITGVNFEWVPGVAPKNGIPPQSGSAKIDWQETPGGDLEAKVTVRVDCGGLPMNHPLCAGMIAHELYHAVSDILCVWACRNMGVSFEDCLKKCEPFTTGQVGEVIATATQALVALISWSTPKGRGSLHAVSVPRLTNDLLP